MDEDNSTVWKYINLRIYPDSFYTSCQISSINKRSKSKTPLNPRTPFRWVFMGIIVATPSKRLTKETIFSSYLLIVDAYSKIPKC